jgi:Fe-S oxidoreductase
MFGPRIVAAFETVKQAFDPAGLLNPGRIVQPPRMDDRTLMRYPPDYAPAPGFVPKLDWSAWPGPLGGMLGAVEMCNNNGACRAFDAGAMCPSYRATLDEQHLTRGRANTLRLALTGQLGPEAMTSDAVAEAVKLCVSCKACRRECPTGVDMAKLKIEVLAARADRHGVALRERMVAELPRVALLARRVPALANMAQRLAAPRLGFAAGRALPAFRGDAFRDSEAPASGDVVLFADCFNRHFEPENLRAALRVLRAAGLTPAVARGGGRPLCCGRTYLSAGMVERARAEARRTLAALRGDMPVVGLEPSCLFTLKDEFPSLLPGAETRALADRVFLIGEFLAGRSLPTSALARTVHVHGHCHQKSFSAFLPSLALLRRITGLQVKEIASSCCGMAGAFGYQAETQEVSRAMAEAGLLPAIRAAGPDDLIVADGTSCRHQIHDLAGREAVHSVRVLDMARVG